MLNSSAIRTRIANPPTRDVGHGPKTIPAKFRSNLPIFWMTLPLKTGERRGTPQQYVGRFATKERGASPPGGVASRPLFFARTALKKGTTSLRLVVKKFFCYILSPLAKLNVIFCLYGAFLENSLSKQNFPSPHMLAVCMQGEGESLSFFSKASCPVHSFA